MIHTVSDAFSKQFCENINTETEVKWEEEYNCHADTWIRVAKINVLIFGKPFLVLLERPIKQVHRSEFEYHFGFGGHCKGYSDTRLIARFLGQFDKELNYEELLNPAVEENATPIDETYIKNVLKLFIMGGYIKYWKAYYEFRDWFMENMDENIQKELSLTMSRSNFEEDFSTGPEIDRMTKSIFEDYEVRLSHPF
jgi:hypothetical protein